jgi:hypothetical protein
MIDPIPDMLSRAKVDVAPEVFTLVSFSFTQWRQVLEDPALGPRMTVPFMILMDKHEVTLLLDEADFGAIRPAVRDAKTAIGYRLLTFDIELGHDVVGFLAKVLGILAEADIPVLAVSAFSRDLLLVRQSDLAAALKALGPFVGELC